MPSWYVSTTDNNVTLWPGIHKYHAEPQSLRGDADYITE